KQSAGMNCDLIVLNSEDHQHRTIRINRSPRLLSRRPPPSKQIFDIPSSRPGSRPGSLDDNNVIGLRRRSLELIDLFFERAKRLGSHPLEITPLVAQSRKGCLLLRENPARTGIDYAGNKDRRAEPPHGSGHRTCPSGNRMPGNVSWCPSRDRLPSIAPLLADD